LVTITSVPSTFCSASAWPRGTRAAGDPYVQIEKIRRHKENALESKDFGLAARFRNEERSLTTKLKGEHAAALEEIRVRLGLVAMDEKPDIVVPSDQAPSYQLEIEDIVVGDGDEAVSGRVVEVHYVGVAWKTGQQFDASWDRGSTFKFGLGKGQVIAGWDQGVAGMRVGGRRRITIPPMLAYGKRGAGRAIGPDETLVFVVDLLSVR
jgi:peptidylprolyl isomerase